MLHKPQPVFINKRMITDLYIIAKLFIINVLNKVNIDETSTYEKNNLREKTEHLLNGYSKTIFQGWNHVEKYKTL